MRILYTLLLCWFIGEVSAQDTFSIVALDTVTGEVGSAGASCLDDVQFPGSRGAIIISKLYPGIGAIHTQSYYNAMNQQRAGAKLLERQTPAQIITWLQNNDAELTPSFRQYGIVAFDSLMKPLPAAGFTGNRCMNYKNHITGKYYAIQGNILLSQAILDSMEARFLRTKGTLAERLMASLQGANVVGADTRCRPRGTSSLSGFLRVARPNDRPDSLYLDLNVPAIGTRNIDPIDSVQKLFDRWRGVTARVKQAENNAWLCYPNPTSGKIILSSDNHSDPNHWELWNALGQRVWLQTLTNSETVIDLSALPKGIYHYRWRNDSGHQTEGHLILQGE